MVALCWNYNFEDYMLDRALSVAMPVRSQTDCRLDVACTRHNEVGVAAIDDGVAMIQTPAHAWMLPQLTDLLARAKAAGISQEVAVAVLTDLIEGPAFNPLPDDAPGR